MSYKLTVYNELAQLIHIGRFTISKQLYITLIKSLFMLKMRFFNHKYSYADVDVY